MTSMHFHKKLLATFLGFILLYFQTPKTSGLQQVWCDQCWWWRWRWFCWWYNYY